MDRHVGDQGGGGHMACPGLTHQGRAQAGTHQFHHVQPRLGQGDARHLKLPRIGTARDNKGNRPVGRAKDRGAAGEIPQAACAIGTCGLLIALLVGLAHLFQPVDDLTVLTDPQHATGNPFFRRTARLRFPSGHLRLQIAHGHRQHAALVQFNNAECAGEFYQGRIFVGGDGQRKMAQVFRPTAGVVKQGGRQFKAKCGFLGKWTGKTHFFHHGNLLLLEVVHRVDPTGGVQQTNILCLGDRHRGGKNQRHRQEGDALGLSVDLGTLKGEGKGRAGFKLQHLFAVGNHSGERGNARAPDQPQVAVRRQTATAANDQQPPGQVIPLILEKPGMLSTQLRRQVALTFLAGDDRHPESLVDALHLEPGGIHDALRRHRGIQPQDKGLLLVDIRFPFARQGTHNGGGAGVKGKGGRARNPGAGEGAEFRLQHEFAADAAGQGPGQVQHPVTFVHPATAAGDGQVMNTGVGQAGIAKGHHRLAEAQLHLANVFDRSLGDEALHPGSGHGSRRQAGDGQQDRENQHKRPHGASHGKGAAESAAPPI